MDYEQKYKEALEMARETFYNQETPYVVKARLLTMFPTIAESTDERIRKGIIELVKQSSEVLDKQNQKDMIDWIEKQGKNKKVSIWKHWKNGIAGNGEGRQIYLIKVGNTYDLSSCLSFECDYIELSALDNLMLEKRGDQNDSCWSKDDQKMLEHIISDLREFMSCETDKELISDYEKEIAWLEKQGEQEPYGQRKKYSNYQFNYAGECKGYCALKRNEHKPTDNVEPKFKVGDWVVNSTTLNLCHVVKVEHGQYICDDCSFPITKENEYHLWTIQDARNGDVLAEDMIESHPSPFVAICKKQDGELFETYCFIGHDGKFYKGEIGHVGEYVHPATKEQCDLLFQKMTDADYEWDSEKKELKEIEPNLVDNNVETKFKVGKWFVNNITNDIFIIKSINTEYCTLEDIKGNIISPCLPPCESDSHLWSIDDAKRGDVLVDAYGNIGIFDKCYDLDWMSCCSLGNNGGFQYFTVEHENEKTHPATKEQCDLLFQKMEEARWEWDSVAKELKKITKFKIGDKVHCGDETQPVTIIGITNDSYTTDSMLGPIPFSEEDNWTLIKHKFNVDDWIVFNGLILHIDEVVNGYYRTTSIGYAIHNSYDWDIDNIARLWDISDAKDGDVLCLGGVIAIFKKYIGNEKCICYCSISEDGDFEIPIENGEDNIYGCTNTTPVTKEQCDLFFQKMTNAGYKWNAKKKELSKQTLKITPKFCIGQMITDNNGTWYKIINIKCLNDWYYEVYDIAEDKTYLELCSNIDERFVFKTIFVRRN